MTRKHETNSIGYSGKVNIKIMRDSTVLKEFNNTNDGKLPLFRFLANTLIGVYSKSGTPKFVSLWADKDGGGYNMKSGMIPYSSMTVVEEGNTAGASFKFLVPFASIEPEAVISHIRIYNTDISDPNSPIASVDLDETLDETINVDGKSNILITWTMELTNKV